nr:immunoglobulin heavy chain junction region [Macaca mulatta]MOW18890.1 immunoglobulin heavy chain junction region [Macaca mulatta]MOW18904.1 immunoglobulin heavy chain junction region [Macaca mulatta]MOW19017.1 immunoglobulin heavy chain junction region [Macaca mulatta]MOW19112.1 immunoglobulin heavy chain junction region [Macaca mulatta]
CAREWWANQLSHFDYW